MATLGIVWALVVTRSMAAVWVLGGLGSIALFFTAVAAARARTPLSDSDSGSLTFRYPPWLRWGSVCLAIAAPFGLTVLLIAYPPSDVDNTFCVVLLYIMAGALTGTLVWDCLRFRMEVGSEGLDCRSPWRRRRFIRWADVVDVSFNGPQGWFEVRATNGHFVRLPALVGDLDAFLEKCERHLTPIQLEPALMAYIFLGRPFPGREGGPQCERKPSATDAEGVVFQSREAHPGNR